MAVKEGNTRCVNTLLDFTSKTNKKGMRNTYDLFSLMVTYPSFLGYVESLPVQTPLMKRIKIVKADEMIADNMIFIQESNTLYLNDDMLDTIGAGSMS